MKARDPLYLRGMDAVPKDKKRYRLGNRFDRYSKEADMPEAVIFSYQGKMQTVYFANARALLPVKLANGEIKLVTWGRRQQETSEMPLGGWARLPAIHAGKWGQYLPKPVRLPVNRFMKTDYEGRVHWYEVTKGQWIQGLLAQTETEYRVYIVTIVPELLDVGHDRWPRIIVR